MLNLSLNTSRALASVGGNVGGLTPSQAAYASLCGLEGEPSGLVLRLFALQAYAKAHGFEATIEPAGLRGCRWGGACLSVVIPWTACDETGARVAEGARTFTVRTFRALRAVLG